MVKMTLLWVVCTCPSDEGGQNMVSCNIGHIFLYRIAIVLWICNVIRACLLTLVFWKYNFQGLTLAHCNQGVPEGYCAMSYIISNPHLRTIWSSKGFRIHPHTAEKTTRFLFRGTFGHTVKCFDFTQIWSIFCVKIIIIFSRWSHWKLHPLVGIRVDPVPVMALQKNFGSLVLFGS